MSCSSGTISVNYKVTIDETTVGVSHLDMSTKEMNLYEFVDDCYLFSNLRILIKELRVDTCILPPTKTQSDINNDRNIRLALENVNVHTYDFFFDITYIKSLEKLLYNNADKEILLKHDFKVALSCCACIIEFFGIENDLKHAKKYKLRICYLPQFTIMSETTFEALGIQSSLSQGMKSVYQLLNDCKTEAGRRLLKQWVQQPLVNLVEIKVRQSIVQEFIENKLLCEKLRSCLTGITDRQNLQTKFYPQIIGILDLDDFYGDLFSRRLPMVIIILETTIFSSERVSEIFNHTYTTKLQQWYEGLRKVEQDLYQKRRDYNTIKISGNPRGRLIGFISCILAHMDVLLSFAEVSRKNRYVLPEIIPWGQGKVVLESAWHPCFIDENERIEYNIEMNSGLNIIAGSRQTGKSMYVNQIAITAIMAQIGCFVPCEKASLCIFNSISVIQLYCKATDPRTNDISATTLTDNALLIVNVRTNGTLETISAIPGSDDTRLICFVTLNTEEDEARFEFLNG